MLKSFIISMVILFIGVPVILFLLSLGMDMMNQPNDIANFVGYLVMGGVVGLVCSGVWWFFSAILERIQSEEGKE